MKSTTILLSLAVLLILAGCQIAKAPENGGIEEEGSDEVVSEETTAPADEAAEDAADAANENSEKEEVFVNPNYDAKLDGDPTQKPASEKDEEEEDDDKDNYVPFIVPEPEKE